MTSYEDISRDGTPDPLDPMDPLAARLRAALTSEADMVNPSDDGLQRIRAGVDSAHRPWWQHPAALAVAAAAVLGLAAGGLAVALGGDDEDDNVVANQTSDAVETPSPSPTTPATASASPVPVEGDVFVYYVMDDPDSGPRLYREQRPNIGMDPVTMALTTMLTEPALDPDYSSPWNGTRLLSYSVSGETATVDLAPPPGAAGEITRLGVQQVVYTVTANDQAVSKVRLLVDGATRLPLKQAVSRAPMVDVQGLIWLLGPTEGATVSSPVAISGVGTAFEGTISWQVRREGSDAVMAEGFTSGGANGEFAEFGDTVELEPGTYELRAFESSAEDGRPIHVDSKTFTVR